MNIEALEGLLGSVDIVDSGILASELAGGPGALSMAIVTGGVSGVMARDMKHALAYSALSGLAAPMFSKNASPDKIMFSALASTGVGLVAYYLKSMYTAREEARKLPQSDPHHATR